MKNNYKNLILTLGCLITGVFMSRFVTCYNKSSLNSNDLCGYKLITEDTLKSIQIVNDDTKSVKIRNILNYYILSSDFDNSRNLVIALLTTDEHTTEKLANQISSVLFQNPENGFMTIDLQTYEPNDIIKLKCDMVKQIKTCSHSVFFIKNISAIKDKSILNSFFQVFNNECINCVEDFTCIKGQIFFIDVKITEAENNILKASTKPDLRKFLENSLGQSDKVRIDQFVSRIGYVI
jgi:hypothetical protein